MMLCSTSAPPKMSKEAPSTTLFGGVTPRGVAVAAGLVVAVGAAAYAAWCYYPSSSDTDLKKKVGELKEKARDLQSNPLDSDASGDDNDGDTV